MRTAKGSATIEMAYIMPVVFLAIIATIYILFYLHDKNIMLGAGYETAVVGNQKLRWDEEDPEKLLRDFFQERVKGKLILFSELDVEVVCDEENITVTASARKRRMRVRVEQSIKRVEPETFIRNVRRIHGNTI